MPYAFSGSLPIYYETEGSSKEYPLVFVGGMIYPLELWFCQRGFFDDSFFCVFIDNRDSGRSGRSASDYTIRDMAEDVISVADSLGLGSFHLVGVSMGGMIAQDLAAFYPDRVSKLVLISTHYGCSDYLEKAGEVWREILDVKGLSLREIYMRGISYSLSKKFFNSRKDVIEKLLFIRERYPQEPEAFFRQFRAASSFCSKDYLSRITCPTLVVGGSLDVVVPKTLVEKLGRSIKNSETVFFEAGHLVLIERHREVNERIRKFLNS